MPAKTTKTFKPLLAVEAEFDKLRFPVLGSPKLDGIRCVHHPSLGPVSRKLLAIPNTQLRQALSTACTPWVDGELIAGSPTAKDAMSRTTSAVMGHDADWSDVAFYVFDKVGEAGYIDRLKDLWASVSNQAGRGLIQVLQQEPIENLDQLMAYEEKCVAAGYEGVMLRDPDGPYKFGRSTVNEGILLKVKRFVDTEGTVVDFIELMHNENEAKKNELGHTKRSSAKAGKVPGNTLGALVLKIDGFNEKTVEIGSGFSAELKQEIWNNRKKYLGAQVTFKYQPHGVKDKPRCPVFKGWRQD